MPFLALVLALASPPSVEALFAHHQCAEVEALADAAPSAQNAYFSGACRLSAGDDRGAEADFDRARESAAFGTLATFMRGLARLHDGRPLEARVDFEAALAAGDLPSDLADNGRELLRTTPETTVHGAATVSLDYDTNALQAPLDNVPGLARKPSWGAFATGVLTFEPAPRWNVRAIVLQRQLVETPEASVGAALGHVGRTFPLGRWTGELEADGGGYLLGWSPFLASGSLHGKLGWMGATGLHAAIGAGGRYQGFFGDYAGLTGPDGSVELSGGARFGPWSLEASLSHAAVWTQAADFARNVETASVEIRRELGGLVLHARGIGGLHVYDHVNSERSESGVRVPREDQRLEVEVGAEYPLTSIVTLEAEASAIWNASNISVYAYDRQLARVGVSCAF